MNRMPGKQQRAEDLLAGIEANGGTVWIERAPTGNELHVGNLSKLPESVFADLMDADIDTTNALQRLVSARKLELSATV